MSNIDKRDIHNQQLKAFITGFLTDPAHDNQSPRSMTAEVFRIALASLEADPVAWRSLYYENHGLLTDSKNVLASWQKQGWECEPLYTAPPAPISDSLLSDLLTIAKTAANAADECAHAEFGDDSMEHSAAIADWERRAAMLHGAEPVSQTYKLNELAGNSPVTPDGWISCSERMPDSKTAVLVAREFARKGDWRMKWATYIPGHPDANDGWIIPGASWKPSHWMPLPEPPQEVK